MNVSSGNNTGNSSRRIRVFGVIVSLFIYLGVCSGAAFAGNVPMIPASFSDLAEKAGPAVVNISTVKTAKGGGIVLRQFPGLPFNDRNDHMNDFFERFFGNERQREFKQRSLGSGFIVDKDGFIVTNNHVVENADQIKVILQDGKEFVAEIIGRDVNTDLALIKIEPDHGLPVLKLGDSDKLKVGEWVVAIGNPFGYDHTVTSGIVSAKGRNIGASAYDDFIQTDTSINPGNSGGPLIDMEGAVVGINTAIIQGGQGIGFAIPSNLAKGIITQLRENGNVTRGWLGVQIQNISSEMADYYKLKDQRGVFVADVVEGDPADSAGIQPKDIIIALDGKSVKDGHDLTSRIANTEVGAKVKVTVLRNGKTKVLTVKIAEKEEDRTIAANDRAPGVDDTLGIRVADVTPETAEARNLTKKEGVVVVSVTPGSIAEETDIRPGDIIEEINHESIRTTQDYFDTIKKIKKGDKVEIVMIGANGGFKVISVNI